MTDLFTPFDLHGLQLPNRILLSAMTRTRATENNVPTEVMRDYFVQRASAGLMLTDCTAVSAQGKGVIRGPGIWRQDQVDCWRMITDAVHAAGGRIYCQLWHCGRVAHPDMRDGEAPVAPSPLPARGDFFLPSGRVDFPVPRELAASELADIVEDFARATKAAQAAGFDGVELHGANGYLQDQFLQDISNTRTDSYGGSVENRARLILETVDAMITAWSADRVGVRLSPSSNLYGMGDSDPRATFEHLVCELDTRRIGYLTMLEPNAKEKQKGVQIEDVAATFRPMTTVPFIINTGYDKKKGDAVIAAGHADLVAYGVPYIANPDLVERFRADAALNKPDPATLLWLGTEGLHRLPLDGRGNVSMTEWTEFAVHRIDTGAATLAVRVGGAGPPVVLLHGFPQHSRMWRRIAPLLAKRFTVIVPDQRGMGASTLPDSGFTKTDMASDLAAVLDALGHECASIAGYDLGAGVAVAFARDFPGRTARLAVMEFVAAGFGLERAMAPKKGWNADSNWHFSVLAAPDVAVWLFAGREREMLNWFFGHEGHGGNGTVDPDDLNHYVRALARPGALRAGAQYYAAIFKDGEDNASLKDHPLAMPVLAVGGASHAGPMLKQLWGPVAQRLETAVIPAAGHWLAEENAADTAGALMHFFTSTDQETER